MSRKLKENKHFRIKDNLQNHRFCVYCEVTFWNVTEHINQILYITAVVEHNEVTQMYLQQFLSWDGQTVEYNNFQ